MNLNGLSKVETPDFYLDVAFSKASKLSSQVRSSARGNRLVKSREIEIKKIDVSSQSLNESLNRLVVSFPSVDQLSEFYVELIKATVGVEHFRKALSRVNWASKKVLELSAVTRRKIKFCKELTEVNGLRNEFYGRASSLFERLRSEFVFLEKSRRTLHDFPVIRPKFFTVAIAGFPNVGKTTLLSKLTGSRPEIAAYAFTTKGINVAYQGKGKDAIQFLDTPGTLNRFNRMNSIEKQAWLALKYCANVIVYVFDLTEPYPLDVQMLLLEEVKKVDRPIILYLSKTDILDSKIVNEFRKRFDCVAGIEELNTKIRELMKEF